jgi:gamma-glutamyltranspeptidase/glutathione hydrolase
MTTIALKSGLVSAPQAEAAHEGAAILAGGGNAADALVTAALVQGVCDPHRCGIGGFGCATIYWKERAEPLCVGFLGRAGGNARADLWADLLEHPAPDGFGYVIRGKANDVGYASITTPGMLAGLAAIHERYGALPWKDLVEQAAVAAEKGFLVGPGLAEFWLRPGLHGRVSTRDRLSYTDYGRRTWFNDKGEPFKSGERVRLEDLARTYRRIAAEGAASFYRGPLAEVVAADLEAHGALVTAEDLRSYQVDIEAPLEGRFRGHRMLTSPLPAGGPALLQALALIEDSPPAVSAHNAPETIDRLARIFRAVWSDRLENHGDPRFQTLGSADLLGASHLDALRRSLPDGPPPPLRPESPDTTQLSIVDRRGNCISFSHSLGYGSGVYTSELGFMYNNCMSGFDPRPGRSTSIAPGKARSTAIAETIVLRNDEPFLVLGSPGAARITAALAQVIIDVVEYEMSVAEAVLQPRFDAYGERTLALDSRFPPAVVDRLREWGWKIEQSPKPFGVIGRVYAVEIGADGRLIAGIDPGEPGSASRG